jgi:hypothetical protein
MKAKIVVGALAIAAVSLFLPRATPSQNNRDNALQMVSGCLEKGPGLNTYSLLDENGKLWEIHSAKIAFANHVGERVSLGGTIPPAPHDPSFQQDRAPQNHLDVTQLTVLADSCQQ